MFKAFFENNKKIILAAFILAAFIIAAVIGHLIYISLNTFECKISKGENGIVQLDANISDLREKNIDYGDSVKFLFSTFYIAEEVPILNGEFMNTGQYVAIATDENSPIQFYIQGSSDFWKISNLNESSTVKISLTKKGQYKNLNNAFNKPVIGDIKNLRTLRGGKLKLLDFVRGVNPNINYDVTSTMYYYNKTMNISNTINLDENNYNVHSMDIKSNACNSMIKERLIEICNLNGRTYIYSNSEDMTAYFCAIIEAIAGASYDEIVNDYMQTYANLYGITLDSNSDEYNAIKTYHIDWFLHKFTKTPNNYDMHNCDFAYDAEMYLRANGLGTSEINLIKTRLSN